MYSVDGAKNVDIMDTWPLHMILDVVQGSAKRRILGLDNFLPAVDYHFCLAKLGVHLLNEPCSLKAFEFHSFSRFPSS